MNFNLQSYSVKITCENENTDSIVEKSENGKEMDLYLTAHKDKPKFIEVSWEANFSDDALVLGDAWERSYGNLGFRKISEVEKYLPWYFIVKDGDGCFCFGVKTQPNAFISFRCERNKIIAHIDCKNGGNGVCLGGRKLHLATFIYEEYSSTDAFECLKDYCKKLCPNPILPSERIYGGNNWYYAYGKSSYGEIIADAKLQVELAKGIDNKPFEVIDDCWQKKKCCGPWLANRKFKDMKKLADDIRELGARPGIWVRLLNNKDRSITKDMRIQRRRCKYLDPSNPKTKEFIKSDIERIKNWGFELIKHDFSTADLFGNFGGDLNESITNIDNWNFYDKTKTNAEIVLDFYRLIKDTSGDMLIIGCNTVSHLCAGLVHINRTGDDTSGKEWERTKKYGVNTLAFRLAQNEAFYMCDADCVGILKDYIPWEKNGQWLHLLSYSNTPLFVSCNNTINEQMKKDLATAYKVFNEPHEFRPVDLTESPTPQKWIIDGEVVEYEW